MSAGHRAVIETGPATVRRMCCGAAESADAATALEWIDDPVGLIDGQPVAVPELLRDVLACPRPVAAVEIIHPSWWPARRVELVIAAAATDDVVARPRAQLLLGTFGAAAVVEIADRLVAVTGAGTIEITAEPRIGSPAEVADAVARRVSAAIRDHPAAVVIDAPAGIGGAAALATMITERLPGELEVVVTDQLPVSHAPDTPRAAEPPPTRIGSRRRLPIAVAAAVSIGALGLHLHHDVAPQTAVPAVYLVEGRVAVQVPADWPVRRVTGGPGSARVEVVSSADPQLALHVTQAPAPADTLAAVAEPLERALRLAEADAPGVFVGFDPAGTSAGRPAVTYREVRGDHQIDWAVLVDGAVRIGVGCQSGPGGADAIRPVCEQAVRSARAIG